jgi:type IV pilus assembly protein PilA
VIELGAGSAQTARVPRRSSHLRGLTLIEVTLLVSLLGIVLAVGIPAFVRGLRTSKTEEPPRELERMYRAIAAYYDTPQNTAAGQRTHCLPDPAGPTPDKPEREPKPVVFANAETSAATWRALGYEPAEPIRYRYSFLPLRAGCGVLPSDSRGEAVLTLRAEGDLDGDGVLSTFERTAVTREGELSLEPVLIVRDRIE